MEEGVLPDEVGLLLKGEAALFLDCFQGGQTLESPVGERLVGERPEVFGRLQLRGVGGQEEEMNALWHRNLLPGVPAGSVQHQDDPFRWSCFDVPSKGSQHLTEEDRFDSWQEPPFGLTGRGTNEATDIEPFVALLDGSDRSLPDRCPHLPDQGEEANAVLIGGPEFDRGVRMGGADGRYLVRELS
jgi:hypothetical protein